MTDTDTTDLVARLRYGWIEPTFGNEVADAIERLTRERDEARAAALEEAANVADEEANAWREARDVAAAIRALKEPT
jgi:hypothetical protein